MKLNYFSHSRKASALAWGAMLATGLFTVNGRADEWTKRTVLTVNEPIMIKDKVLEPGKYVLRLILNGTLGVDRHVVQVFDGDEHHIIETVITQPTIRARATGNTVFTFWETPAGSTRALRDWYYPGETTGDEFPNAKPQQVTFVPPPPMAAAAAEETTTTTPAEQPVVMDDTTQAPPPAVEPTPAPAPEPEPSADRSAPMELPKTGSLYPLIGLCGLGCAGLAGILALKRPA